MIWKLTLLGLATLGLIFCLVPIRTRAVVINPAAPSSSTNGTLRSIVSDMYLTPGTIVLICVILAAACYIAFRIVRSA